MWTTTKSDPANVERSHVVFSTEIGNAQQAPTCTYLIVHIVSALYPQSSQQLRENISYCVHGWFVIQSPPVDRTGQRALTFFHPPLCTLMQVVACAAPQ